jgi:hypothetical protein
MVALAAISRGVLTRRRATLLAPRMIVEIAEADPHVTM